MEIKIIASKEVEKEEWDDLISCSMQCHVYALYDYLNLCEREWKAVVMLSGGSYQAAIPLQLKKTYFFAHLYQDPFCPEMGLFSRQILSDENLAKMLSMAFSGYRLVSKYFFNVDNTGQLQKSNFFKNGSLSNKITFHLNLNQPYEEIYKGYSTNRKRDLKKAEKYQQSIQPSQDVQKLIQIFKAHTAHKISGIENYQYELLQRLYINLLEQGVGELYFVHFGNEIVSAAFFTKYKNKVVFLFGPHTGRARELRSSTFVLDYFIKKYAHRDFIFDFEGGHTPDIIKYYSSFGGEKKYFYEYRKNELPPIIRAAKNLRENIVKKLKG